MKEGLYKTSLGAIKKVLKEVLVLEANSTSCVVLYQPKPPAGLSKFEKNE